MKICVINSLYPPYSRGGAETVVTTLIKELRKNHEISVITVDRWKGFASLWPHVTVDDGVRVHRFYPANIFSYVHIERWPAIVRLAWHCIDTVNVHSYFTVRGILKRECPDLVLTHNLKGIGYPSVRAIASLGIRHIHTMHDVQLIAPSGLILWGQENSWMHTSLLTRMYRALCRLVFRRVSSVIFPSRFLRDIHKKHHFFPHTHIKVLANPAEYRVDHFIPRELHSPCRFLFLGQLESHKGVRVLLDAYSRLGEGNQLIVVGRGSLESVVCAATQTDPSIRYEGYISDREKIRRLIADVDFMVIPTLCYENSPMVLYEAFSQGVPVIVSNIGGAAELADDGRSGFIVEPGNREALLDALRRASMLDADLYRAMQCAAIERLRENTLEHYCASLLEVEDASTLAIPHPTEIKNNR